MIYTVVACMALLGGTVQTVTGFGGGVVMMLALPYFFGMVQAPAISSIICMGLTYALAWKFRKYVNYRSVLVPAVAYVICSVATISVVDRIDMEIMTLAFGVFLIVLSVYSLVFSKRIRMDANWRTGLFCGAVSGVLSGLFGIGGPLMAVYFVAATDSKETYIGSTQFLFSLGGTVNFLTRIFRGIYTLDMVPLTLAGILAISLGKLIGLKIVAKLDPETIRKLVYLFVGISGAITVCKCIL